mmetsp:Transcript_106162/g.297186  ORF Transcript_106162/g.297186 Transcript_106162/m.297186 type:complete len:246 (+) Transcript_106162:588-1325(+)
MGLLHGEHATRLPLHGLEDAAVRAAAHARTAGPGGALGARDGVEPDGALHGDGGEARGLVGLRRRRGGPAPEGGRRGRPGGVRGGARGRDGLPRPARLGAAPVAEAALQLLWRGDGPRGLACHHRGGAPVPQRRLHRGAWERRGEGDGGRGNRRQPQGAVHRRVLPGEDVLGAIRHDPPCEAHVGRLQRGRARRLAVAATAATRRVLRFRPLASLAREETLRPAGSPLHRDEILRRFLRGVQQRR